MRLSSIDILRAITMLLMIWVNDFWTLTEVPRWLEHAGASEDYMGFSDVIFPLFLFIIGLSIPFAIENRKLKKDSNLSISKHIISRSVSLLLIGVFMVNYETIHQESVWTGKYLWCILMALAVILIWMDWKRTRVPQKWHIFIQAFGFIILLFLAIVYKGGTAGDQWMTTQWWGILGLIGWAYLVNACAYLFTKGNLLLMIAFWLLFNVLAVLDHSGMSLGSNGFLSYFSPVISGTIPAFTAAGIVTSLLFQKISKRNIKWAYLGLSGLGLFNILYGIGTRPFWGISKIQGTPSWLGICTGIGILLFVILYYISDEKKHTKWARIIAPAGTATLTCYMLPYFIYPLQTLLNFHLPDFLHVGGLGLLISFGFALIVVIFTGWMERKGYKLKL